MKKFFARFKEREGSALALTMFILAGMLVVAMSGSYIVLLGIKASGVQSQSTKAYFAAESGAEDILWKLRKGYWVRPSPSRNIVWEGQLPSGGSYKVYYLNFAPLYFNMVGDYKNTKRSVQLRM